MWHRRPLTPEQQKRNEKWTERTASYWINFASTFFAVFFAGALLIILYHIIVAIFVTGAARETIR